MNQRTTLLERLAGPLKLGLGGAPLGNLYTAVTDADAERALEEAWRLGLRYFDTAPLYGHGLSELRLGRMLQAKPREDFVLSTKVGRLLRPDPAAPPERDGYVHGLPLAPHFDYSFDGALRSIDESLQRLGLARIDIALIHDIDRHTHGPGAQPARFREAMQGAYRALERLRGEGVLGTIGIGVNEWEVCRDALAAGDFDCMMLAGRYTLLDDSAAGELVPLCMARGVKLILAGVFNSGILASGAVQGARFHYQAAPEAVRSRVARIASTCAAFGVALPAAALQFALACPAAAAVVVGSRSGEEIAQNVAHAQAPIPPALWEALAREGR